MSKIEKTENANFVRSVGRALSIMESIAGKKNVASLTEISVDLGLSKGTVHSLLYTLSACGYVKQDGEKGKYSLDLKLFELGQIVQDSLDLKTISKKYTRALLDQFGETVQLGVLSGKEVIYLDKLEGNHTIGSLSRIGARLPSHCTGLGKVLLSGLSNDQIKALIKEEDLKSFTAHTATTYDALFAKLEEVRAQGYALDDEEIELGLRCTAAPIWGSSGNIVAAVSISGPTTRIHKDMLEAFIQGTLECGQKISRDLGYVTSVGSQNA